MIRGMRVLGVGGREEESRMTALGILVDGSARFSVEVEELNFGHVRSETFKWRH